MCASDINDELLSEAGLARVREVLTNSYSWFMHVSPINNFDKIQAAGLELKYPGGFQDVVAKRLGNEARNVICLRPFGSSFCREGSKQGVGMLLAVSVVDLPERLGVDWSDGYGWALLKELRDSRPEADTADLALEAIQRSGTMISYDSIPACKLVVCPEARRQSHPYSWPRFQHIDESEVFDRNLNLLARWPQEE